MIVGLTASFKWLEMRVQSTCCPTHGLVALINDAHRFALVSNVISVTATVIVLATVSVLGASCRPCRPIWNENPFSTFVVSQKLSQNNNNDFEKHRKASILSSGSLMTDIKRSFEVSTFERKKSRNKKKCIHESRCKQHSTDCLLSYTGRRLALFSPCGDVSRSFEDFHLGSRYE